MEASTISLLAQIPLVGIFVWFTLRMSTMAAKSLETRDEAWHETLSGVLEKAEQSRELTARSQATVTERHIGALQKLTQMMQAASEQLAAGQQRIRRQNARITALLIGHLRDLSPAEADDFVHSVFDDDA